MRTKYFVDMSNKKFLKIIFFIDLGYNRLPQVTARRYQMYQLGDVHQTRCKFLTRFFFCLA